MTASNLSDDDDRGETPLADLLAEAAVVVVRPSASQAKLLEKLRDLRERLLRERFQLAVLGHFKRGKSTLLNALLGADALPTGVIPVTAIPTFLTAGTIPRLRVSYATARIEESTPPTTQALRAQLATLVTEDGNPDNTLGIARVEAELPSPFLAQGVVLIDTPGVGSTHQHNTDAAHAVLAECDAALFVLSPDPPITEVEVTFLTRIRPTVARLIIVLNKTDTLEPPELQTAATFLRRVLTEQAHLDPATPIFCLSARAACRANEAGDTDARRASGIEELAAHLTQFLAHEKRATLHAAVARKVTALLGDLQLETRIVLQALRLPQEDLTRRLAAFDEAAGQFETERRTAHDLLAGDRLRALAELEADAERLRKEGRAVFEAELAQSLAGGPDEEQARAALAGRMTGFFDDALKRTTDATGERLAGMLGVHQRRADGLISLVRRTAADLLEIPFRAPEGGEAFEARRAPFWVTRPRPELPYPIPPGAFDRFLPAPTRQARLKQRLSDETAAILSRNVENLRWATRQNLEEAFRRFGSELDERLSQSLAATHGAMAAALTRRQPHAAQVAAEIETIQAACVTLAEIEAALACFR